MCCRFLAQSDMKRGGGVKRLMPAWNGCYVFGGPSASVTPRASSAYHEFSVHTQYDAFMKCTEWTKPVTTAA
jgi:hypothetical protein